MPSACMAPMAAGSRNATGSPRRLTVIEGTLAKAFGAMAAISPPRRPSIDYIRSTAPGFIFTTSLPPAVVGGGSDEPAPAEARQRRRRAALFRQVALLKRKLDAAGLPRLPSESHIVPLMIRDADLCREVSRLLLERHGHYATPINYPTVPRGTERLRLTPTPCHTEAMMDDLIAALADIFATVGQKAA